MNSMAFSLINLEAMAYKAHLKHEAELTHQNVSSLKKAKMKIEAMLGGALCKQK